MTSPTLAAPAAPLEPPRVAQPATDARAARAFTVFTVLWACAALFHHAAWPQRAFGTASLLVTLPALWLLMRPGSVPRLALLAVGQLAQVWRVGPERVSNHWAFTTFVNLTILLALARVLWREHSGRVEKGALFLDFAPVVRLELLVLYFYAVLHKLNTDFLDPTLSCAAQQYGQIAAQFPLLPTAAWAQYSAIYGTLLVELAIPVLLVVRRTRLAGVLLATLFHFVLAVNPEAVFYDFSSMLFAVYFLYLPHDYWGALRERWVRSGAGAGVRARVSGRTLRLAAKGVLALIALAVVAAWLKGAAPRQAATVNAAQEGARLAWVVYGGLLIAAFLTVARGTPLLAAVRGLDSLRPRTAVPALVLLLLLLNGLSPYLGLKTDNSFSMFSNLRTEGERWNHAILPPSMKVAGYQDDLVEIVSTSHPYLERIRRAGQRLTYFDLRVRASERPAAAVTYVRGGRTYVVPRVADDPELRQAPALRRLFAFRPVDPPGVRTPCRH